jgi:uncharacterized protein
MSTIDTIVLKVAAPCNLSCTYCYEYRTDLSWRQMPKHIPEAVLRDFCARMVEHVEANRLQRFFVNVHGGEPMLLGEEGLDDLFTLLKDRLGNHVALHLGMQTNATLATPAIAEVLRRHDVSVGISIDGPQQANRYRIGHDGEEVFDRIVGGLQTLRDGGVKVAGALAVINRAVPAVDTLNFLADLGFSQVDLLQPIANHDLEPLPKPEGPTLGEWWSAGFKAWATTPRLASLRVRFFEDAIRSVLEGIAFTSEFFGHPPRGYLVVRTDGTYEGHDYNKINGTDGRVLGMNVRDHEMSEVLSHPALSALHWLAGSTSVPTDCRDCAIATWCKGGSLPTRYSRTNGYDNRSVYCGDLQIFFNTLGQWLVEQAGLEEPLRRQVASRLAVLATVPPYRAIS